MKKNYQNTNKKLKTVLILFGSNAVSYNAAAALYGKIFYAVSLIPKNGNKLNKLSNKFNRFSISKYKWNSIGFVNDLIDFIKSIDFKGKILTLLTNDQAIEFWIKNQQKLSQYCSIGIDNIETFYRKDIFYKQLDGIGICYPETWDSYKNIPNDRFPIIIKPAFKNTTNKFISKFHSKIMVVENTTSIEWINEFEQNELVYQRKINFEIGDEYSWWGYRQEKGVIFSVCAQHLNKYPDKSGRITHVKLVDNANITAIGNKIVDELDYAGIADIQMIHDKKTDTFQVIEMNPRLWCSHELLLMNNINFIEFYADYFYKNGKKLYKMQYHKDFNRKQSVEWFSILYRIKNFKFFNFKNTEYYEIEKDRIVMRILVKLYLLLKYIYYFLRKI